MKIFFSPISISNGWSSNPIVDTKLYRQIASGNARSHYSFVENRKLALDRDKRCQLCAQRSGLEAHHINPIWVLSTKLFANWADSYNWQMGYRDAYSAFCEFCELVDYSKWHDVKNLIVLCKRCHVAVGKSDNKKHKKQLKEFNSRIFFGHADAERFWDSCLNKESIRKVEMIVPEKLRIICISCPWQGLAESNQYNFTIDYETEGGNNCKSFVFRMPINERISQQKWGEFRHNALLELENHTRLEIEYIGPMRELY